MFNLVGNVTTMKLLSHCCSIQCMMGDFTVDQCFAMFQITFVVLCCHPKNQLACCMCVSRRLNTLH